MLGNIVGVSPNVASIGLRVFPVVILGGLDSIKGAVVGGAIIGLLEVYTGGYVGHGLNLIVPYAVLILVPDGPSLRALREGDHRTGMSGS